MSPYLSPLRRRAVCRGEWRGELTARRGREYLPPPPGRLAGYLNLAAVHSLERELSLLLINSGKYLGKIYFTTKILFFMYRMWHLSGKIYVSAEVIEYLQEPPKRLKGIHNTKIYFLTRTVIKSCKSRQRYFKFFRWKKTKETHS